MKYIRSLRNDTNLLFALPSIVKALAFAKAKKHRISVAEYLRNLIVDDCDRDKEIKEKVLSESKKKEVSF